MSALEVQRDAFGKPHLQNYPLPLHYNLSHTEDWVVMAVCRVGELGVDVESSARSVEMEGVARAFFHADEHQALRQQVNPQAKIEHFFSLWTLKEAWVKGIGKGLAQCLRSICFDLRQAGSITARGSHVENWQFSLFRPDASHLLALCLPTAVRQLHVRCLTPLLHDASTTLPLLRQSSPYPLRVHHGL